jgi:hypothetical protein
MYNVIFGPLASYVTDKIYWKKRIDGMEREVEEESNNNREGEEQRNFTVSSLSLFLSLEFKSKYLSLSCVEE